jgi:hypothetical protein
MQSLRDGPLQSRLCLLHRVRQQLAASEPRRLKKMDTGNCRARQARALDLISFFKLAGCSSSDGRKQLHRYREYLLARPSLNELFLPKDGSKQCDAFAVARKPVC